MKGIIDLSFLFGTHFKKLEIVKWVQVHLLEKLYKLLNWLEMGKYVNLWLPWNQLLNWSAGQFMI